MNNPLDSEASQNIGLLLARVPLGAYLAVVGYERIANGVGNFAGRNHAALDRFVPGVVSSSVLHALPFAEVAAGTFLVLGIFSRVGGLLASLVFITVMLAMTGSRGRDGLPFDPRLILCGFAVYLCCAGAGGISLDRVIRGKAKRA